MLRCIELLVVALALTGCYERSALQVRNSVQYSTNDLKVIVDPDTGCHYIWTDDVRGPLTPRMLADGTQLCLKEDLK